MEYKEAVIEKDTGKVYYEFYNDEKERYKRFYVNESSTEPKEVRHTINRALSRGYNPYKHGKGYKFIESISSIKVNLYFLFIVFLPMRYEDLFGSIKMRTIPFMLVAFIEATLLLGMLIFILWLFELCLVLPESFIWSPNLLFLFFYLFNEFVFWRLSKKEQVRFVYKHYAQECNSLLLLILFALIFLCVKILPLAMKSELIVLQ